MKIIAINGGKHSKKEILASMLAQNSDCVWVKPYTDRDIPVNQEDWEQDGLVHLNERKLSDKMEREIPLCETVVNGNRYVFFENQFNASYCVMIADDRVINYLQNNWKGKLVTVKCHSVDEEYSERFMLPDNEFDIVFDVENDDYDYLEAMVQ